MNDFLEQLARRARPTPDAAAPPAVRPRMPGLFEPIGAPEAPLFEAEDRAPLAPQPEQRAAAAPVAPVVPQREQRMSGAQAKPSEPEESARREEVRVAPVQEQPAAEPSGAPTSAVPASLPLPLAPLPEAPKPPESRDPPPWGVLRAPPTAPAVGPLPAGVHPAPDAAIAPPDAPPGEPVRPLATVVERDEAPRGEGAPASPQAQMQIIRERELIAAPVNGGAAPGVVGPLQPGETVPALRPSIRVETPPAERREALQPTITVSIGRIDIRAAPQARPAQRREERGVMSLDEYLRRRNQGGDR